MTKETNNPNDPFVTLSMLEKAMKAQEARILTAVGELLSELISDLMAHIDERFNRIEARLDNHAARLEILEQAPRIAYKI
jgi:hypothetical protein